jgi:glycerol-3-phosphate acyltransferase PlsX
MGNSNAPEVLLHALARISLPKGVELVGIGLPEYQSVSKIEYLPAASFIGMEEAPLAALRRKKDSSICIGLRHLKEGTLDAFVSAGNTGALVSGAKMIVGNLPGILRPALLTQMPTKKAPVAVLDVGANVSVQAVHLVQFAWLGAMSCRAQGIERPVVGLLNIGSEEMKGTSELQQAYQLLKELVNPPFHFAGNIEGKSVFEGEVDVLITDGFTGNIFLKTAEGIASLILDRFSSLLPPEEYKKLGPRIQDLKRHLHYAEYPGAYLIGLKKPVRKCHGYSTPEAFVNAVLGTVDTALNGITQAIEDQINKFKIFSSKRKRTPLA